MAYETLQDFDCQKTTAVGGIRVDQKTGKRYKNPTSIEGYFVGTKGGIENKKNPEKPTNLHIFETDAGNVGVWGKTDLDQKMARAKIGLKTLVQFDKMVPTNKNPMFKYIVKQDPKDVNPALQAAAPESAEPETDGSYESGGSNEAAGEEEAYEEEGAIDEEEEALDEPAAAAAKPPKAAQAPSPDRQARLQGLLGKKSA